MSEEHLIKFKYVFPENYNPTYCNGAYGGISTHGEIVANFFLERMPIPNSITHAINSNGSLSGITETDPQNLDKTVIRYISTGIVISETSAKAIHEWLGNQIQELENRKAIQNTTLTESE